MKKHCFYHILCKNDYVNIHNRIFAKILSNPFFDDAQFYFSVVGDEGLNTRLLMPNIPPIVVKYQDYGSEYPAFKLMYDNIENISNDDYVFYFHSKGSSRENLRYHDNYQNTLKTKLAINNWTDLLCFFLVDKIQEYTKYLIKYGSVCAFNPRHLTNDNVKSGSTGNFWWVTGDVAKSIKNLGDIRNKERHYFELHLLSDLLDKSDRKYKSSFYVHDGAMSTYGLEGMNNIEAIDGYWNEKFIDLINMDIPLNEVNPSMVIVSDNHKDIVLSTNDMRKKQRFKNFVVVNKNQIIPKSLLVVYMLNGEIENNLPNYLLDSIARIYKNSSDVYDARNNKYLEKNILGYRVVPFDNISTENNILELLCMLEPVNVTNFGKIRVGSIGDGGYVMLDNIKNKKVLSFGIGHTLEYEQEMVKTHGCEVHAYDCYINCSDPNVEIFKKCIGVEETNVFITLEKCIENIKLPTIIKMDIEGDEWKIFENCSPETLECFEQIVVEFHNFDKIKCSEFFKTAKLALGNILKNFVVSHVHANPYGQILNIDGHKVIQTIEVTFANKKMVQYNKYKNIYPTEFDHNKNLKLDFYPFN